MIPTVGRVSPLPVLVGFLFIFAAVGLIIWLYGSAPRDRVDPVTEGAKVSRIGTRAEFESLSAEIDRISGEIDDPREPFERLNRRSALSSGMTETEYESAVATNRQIRVAGLTEKRDSLIEQRDRLKAQLDAPLPSSSRNYGLIFAVLPFTLLGLYVFKVAMADELPGRNPAGLSDAKRRGLLIALSLFLLALTIFSVGLTIIARG